MFCDEFGEVTWQPYFLSKALKPNPTHFSEGSFNNRTHLNDKRRLEAVTQAQE
jgi:hypothetical protein